MALNLAVVQVGFTLYVSYYKKSALNISFMQV